MFGLMVAMYPLAVYFGIQKYSIEQVSLFVLSIVILRFIFQNNKDRQQIMLVIAASGLILFSLLSQNILGIRLYPVLINTSLFVIFTLSLIYPPSFIEKLARLSTPDLPDSGVRYTNNVTKVWCLFFVINGSIAAYTALFSTMEVWALYNGFFSYLAMGFIFTVEFFVRQKIKRNNA